MAKFIIEEGILVATEFSDNPLQDQIEKWECIINFYEKNPGEVLIDGSWLSSGLCQLHPICDGCPIKQVTGKTNCEGTPYWMYVFAVEYCEPENAARYAKDMLSFVQQGLVTIGD